MAVPIFLPRVSAARAARTPSGHSYYFGTPGSNPSKNIAGAYETLALWAVQMIKMPYSLST
jgi:hypothetical protein